MIFHTAADKNYYDSFYELFSKSIRKNCKNQKISFNFVGVESLPLNFSDIFTQDCKSLKDIETIYKTKNRDTLGYYALSRWLSIPVVNEHVAVCDIDIISINQIDVEIIEQLLKIYPVINVTRIKPNGVEGGMMVMILRKDICAEVKEYAQKILIEKPITWSRDVDIRTMLYEKYAVKNVLKMYQVTKRTTEEDLKNRKEWFIFSKGNLDQKTQRILYAEKNF